MVLRELAVRHMQQRTPAKLNRSSVSALFSMVTVSGGDACESVITVWVVLGGFA